VDKKTHEIEKEHWWIVLLCCLIPIAAIAAIAMLSVPGNSVLYFGLLLLCPLLHLVMMSRMGHHGEHQHRPTFRESDQAGGSKAMK